LDQVNGEDRDYLQACRRVLAAGVLARDRTEVLAIDPGRWPQGAAHLRSRLAAHDADPSPEAEHEMLECGLELQLGLAAAALLRLQLDCARIRFVFEETAMRLHGDPLRFAHAESHGRLLQRLADARVSLRAGRLADARAQVEAFRVEAAQHAETMDVETVTGTGRGAGEAA
jgi:hypothetical protein